MSENETEEKVESSSEDLALAESVLYETLMDIACDHTSPDSERAFEACLAFRKARDVQASQVA